MTTYVLVHGAWHGAWCWRPVADRLRAAGHEVVTPTLTGLAERAHLTAGVDLSTHVRDVSAAVEFDDLRDVVLVGHSYAGMVVSGVAAAIPQRLRRLVIVDGFLPDAGQPAIDLLPPHAAAHYRESAAPDAAGVWLIPPRPLANLGVTDPAAVAAITPRLTPHPLQTYLDGSPGDAASLTVSGAYVLCAGWNTPFGAFADKAERLGWPVARIPADHEVPLTNPDLLAASLLAAADRTEAPA
ncbi:alpha/beta hydrolase [Asanoa iriomotensis]|uniref:AB hydrolase-1 domain-containing protein n=1 Tax=Asanoa iriomotensis TaxID=234613 RepID=A0ABQ4BVW6_9ACTN|nr:alpha/beta fold hydrolase [Asanoa iriomotensis]GIF54645.1 hypothetical protein Air01nite_07400 [Asanoa iriomotensis]